MPWGEGGTLRHNAVEVSGSSPAFTFYQYENFTFYLSAVLLAFSVFSLDLFGVK